MKPLISFIMPVYNNETYFQAAVESVLGQGDANIELVIIDDGSTDQTPQIADRYAAADARVKVAHQENQWIYASFNNGIRAAEGEYIYILNSDDRLRDGSVPLLCQTALTYRPDVVWTKVLPHSCDARQQVTAYDVYHYGRLVQQDMACLDTASVRANWLYFYTSKLAFNQANLYRRELALRHPFRNDVYGADQLFNLSIAPDVQSAVVLKEPVYDHFLYEADGMNVSKGNYYGYEHQMFHEIYQGYVELFRSWGLYDKKTAGLFAAMRLNNVTNEIRSLCSKRCALPIKKKLEKVFTETLDSLVWDCAVKAGRVEELNARVLSGCRELLVQEWLQGHGDIQSLGEYRFVYDYLEAVLRYEKTEEDLEKMRHAVFHKRNQYRIGHMFYEKLSGSKKW